MNIDAIAREVAERIRELIGHWCEHWCDTGAESLDSLMVDLQPILATALRRFGPLPGCGHARSEAYGDILDEMCRACERARAEVPSIGAVRKCLICGCDKPWALFDRGTGAAACEDCRDAPVKLKNAVCRTEREVFAANARASTLLGEKMVLESGLQEERERTAALVAAAYEKIAASVEKHGEPGLAALVRSLRPNDAQLYLESYCAARVQAAAVEMRERCAKLIDEYGEVVARMSDAEAAHYEQAALEIRTLPTTTNALAVLLAKAREDEREACAKIVDNGADAKINVPVVARKALAAAIRARGGKTK